MRLDRFRFVLRGTELFQGYLFRKERESGRLSRRMDPLRVFVGNTNYSDHLVCAAIIVCAVGLAMVFSGSWRRGRDFLAPATRDI